MIECQDRYWETGLQEVAREIVGNGKPTGFSRGQERATGKMHNLSLADSVVLHGGVTSYRSIPQADVDDLRPQVTEK